MDAMLAAGVPLAAAVTCDPAYPDIFVTGCKTVKTVTRMAKRHNKTVGQIDLGASRIARPAGRWPRSRRKACCPCARRTRRAAGVRLYAAASPFDECEHAAAYIRRKLRDEGARYRDFVVCARDIEPYSGFLAMAMARYDVAVFLAEKPDLLSRPPMALVTGALRAVQNYFKYEDLFGCLKTGLTSLTRDEVDQLENYVLTWNIRGGAWERDWTEHPDGYGLALDDGRARSLPRSTNCARGRSRRLSPCAKRSWGSRPSSDCVRALYAFLLAVDRARPHVRARRSA